LILAVLQARMNAPGLPGKALMPLVRAPLIARQIERMARARRIDRVVVVTTVASEDDAIEAAARREAIPVHRGPANDELARLIGALDAHPADHVLRLDADSPLVDPEVLDATLDLHLTEKADHTTNRSPGAAWPVGQGAEVITAQGLRRIAAEGAALRLFAKGGGGAGAAEARLPDRWSSLALLCEPDQGAVRWAVEGPADYAFVAAVYDALYPVNRAFTSADVRALLAKRDDLATFGGVRRL
jgi:spore coat polysaccharide biosynthesis protein SpsF (cytidylyltransferase family)